MSDEEDLTPSQLRMVAEGVAAAARMYVNAGASPESVQVREASGISEKRYLSMVKPVLKSFETVHQTLISCAAIMEAPPEANLALLGAVAEKVQQAEAGEGTYTSTMWKDGQDSLEDIFKNSTHADFLEVEVRIFLTGLAKQLSDWSAIMSAALQGDIEGVHERIALSRASAQAADIVREEQCRLLDMGQLDDAPDGPRVVRWDPKSSTAEPDDADEH